MHHFYRIILLLSIFATLTPVEQSFAGTIKLFQSSQQQDSSYYSSKFFFKQIKQWSSSSSSKKQADNNNNNKPFQWGYYKINGPHTWHDHFPNAYGCEQSPINIDTKSPTVGYDRQLTALKFISYTQPTNGYVLKNNGRGVVIEFGDIFNYSLSGGPLTSPYHLYRLMIHWGVTDRIGSEHRIDGHAFAAELQFVHFNKIRYGTFDLASKYADGLAIVTVFLKLGGAKHEILEPIVANHLKLIPHKGQAVKPGHALNLTSLLPEDVTQYWTYYGSLTQPPLTENAIWVVLRNAVEIEKQQLANFRKIYPSNIRPVRPLKDRVVRSSFRKSDSCHN